MEGVPKVESQSSPESAIEKTKAAIMLIESRFSEKVDAAEEPQTFVDASGREFPCDTEADFEKAKAQQAVAIAEQLLVNELDYYEEKAARSLLEVQEAILHEVTARLSHESKAGRLPVAA